MKKAELMTIRLGINLLGDVSSVALGNYFSKILEKVVKEVEHLEGFKKTKSWQEIDMQISTINQKYAKRDKDGKFLVENESYVFDPEGEAKRKEETDKLEVEKADIFTERKKLLEEYKELLQQDYTEALPKIPYTLILTVEKEYKEAKKESPFKAGIITLLWPVIDESK